MLVWEEGELSECLERWAMETVEGRKDLVWDEGFDKVASMVDFAISFVQAALQLVLVVVVRASFLNLAK